MIAGDSNKWNTISFEQELEHTQACLAVKQANLKYGLACLFLFDCIDD